MNKYYSTSVNFQSLGKGNYEVLVKLDNMGRTLKLDEFCKRFNYEFIQIITTPSNGYRALFINKNHHSVEMNKELWS